MVVAFSEQKPQSSKRHAPDYQELPTPSMMKISSITHAERRKLGRFDSPRPLAQALADWAIQKVGDRILEPSSGGGVIVKSAISRLLEIGAKCPEKQIWACDIDQRALAETADNVRPHLPHLVLGNFLKLTRADFGNHAFDVILGNPPYVRLHTMDTDDRMAARKAVPPTCVLDAKASLWAYFPLHAFKVLTPGGRMGWILPETLLHAKYGREVLNWATQNFDKCIAVSLRERCFESEGAKERVVVLLLVGSGGKASQGVEMVEFASAQECIASLPRLATTSAPGLPQLNGHAVPHLVSNIAATAAQVLEASEELKRFGDFADVKIGVVTGNNKFFVLDDEQRASAQLNRRHFQRVVSKFADLGETVVFSTKSFEKAPKADRKSWLLCPNPESLDRRLARHLKTYEAVAIQENRTMEKRSNWQVPVLGEPPDAFFRYMGKIGPRIVLNETGHFCTNTIHRVFFNKGISKTVKRAICLSLHSSYSQLYAEFEGRQYGSGVLKFEPSETKRLLFALNEPLVETLSVLWTKFTKGGGPESWEGIVPHIDSAIAAHCPKLAKSLPIKKVRTLLIKVRQRRNSFYLVTGV
jgi:adenine-specific DNA-methyltransferase